MNIRTKYYQNLMIGFKVTIKNVGDVFFETLCSIDTVAAISGIAQHLQRLYGVGQKMCHFTFVYIFTNNRFSKFFHWHILQTICDNLIIIDPTTP